LAGIVARMKPSTEAMWVERIEEWTRSGLSAAEFAEGKPFTSGTLTWAASRLRKETEGSSKKRKGRPRRAPKRKIQLAEVIRRPSRIGPIEKLVLEVSGARVFVERGFDRVLLRDIVLALRGEK